MATLSIRSQFAYCWLVTSSNFVLKAKESSRRRDFRVAEIVKQLHRINAERDWVRVRMAAHGRPVRLALP